MFIDGHSDLLSSLYYNNYTIKNHNMDLKKGKFKKIIAAFYEDYVEVKVDIKDMVNKTNNALKEIEVKYIKAIEDLDIIKNIDELEYLIKNNFKMFSLTWNFRNKLASGVLSSGTVTNFGRSVIEVINKNKLIFDMSHLNEESFYDIIEILDTKIVYSHGNCKSIHNHKRNLSDLQLKKLKEKDGLFCLSAIKDFVGSDSLQDLLKHIKKAIELMSINNVAFGFDFLEYFGSDKNLTDLRTNNTASLLKLLEENFNKEEIEKLTYKNIERHLKEYW